MGSVYKRDNSWIVKYRLNGKVKRKAIGNIAVINKTMAKKILREIEQEIKLG